jgi:hypothetical protein
MLKSIRTRTHLPVIDGVLIKGQSLHDAQRHDSIVDRAQRHARATVARAESEADAIRQYAAARGYREGVHEAWQSIAPWLSEFERHCSQALCAFESTLRNRLEAALHEPTVVEFVVRRVFDDIARSRTREIRIFVPSGMSGLRANFLEWAAEAALTHVVVVPCDDDRLTVECGDNIYLFDIQARAAEWGSELPRPASPDSGGASPEPLDTPNSATRNTLASVDTASIRQSERTHARLFQSASSNTMG